MFNQNKHFIIVLNLNWAFRHVQINVAIAKLEMTYETYDVHVFPINEQANSSEDTCAIFFLLADSNRLWKAFVTVTAIESRHYKFGRKKNLIIVKKISVLSFGTNILLI